MNSKPMSLSRLRELVAAYGSNVARFPESERAAAQALLDISEHARMLLASERHLDGWLDAASPPGVPAELARRLASIPRAAHGGRAFPVRRRALWAPAVGWAVAAAVGVWIGTQSPDAEAETLADATVASDGSDDGAFDLSDPLLDALEEMP